MPIYSRRLSASQRGSLLLLKKIIDAVPVSPTAAGTEGLGGKKLVLPLVGAGSDSKQWPFFD